MTLDVKLWRVASERLETIDADSLDNEGRLENWICEEIEVLNSELLVIGRQVSVAGGAIDLLAVDSEANLVVIELKRDKTPRDVIAQALDYASCIKDFGLEEIDNATQDHLQKSFEEAFREKFDQELPESVNGHHRILIVASSLDSTTQRILRYLADTHGVDINAATFTYFKSEQGEFFVRSFLLSQDEISPKSTKRRRYVSEAELREMAERHDVAELWDVAISNFSDIIYRKNPSMSTLSFARKISGGDRSVMSLFPQVSSASNGLAVNVVFEHFVEAFNVDETQLKEVCGSPAGTKFDGSYCTTENCFYFDKEKLNELSDLARRGLANT